MKYSACIEMLFDEVPFIQRINKAKENNFDAIEFWDWQEKDIDKIRDECVKNDISVAAFIGNTRGQMVNPEDNKDLITGIGQSIKIAKELQCNNLLLTTNILGEDRSVLPTPADLTEMDKKKNIEKVLSELAPIAEKSGITMVLEPLNVLVDHPGYFLDNSKIGFEVLNKVNSPNIKLLYDIYHMQIMEGNIINTLENNIDLIGHIHIADVPGRREPGTGEINYSNIYNKLVELDYKNYAGFEYQPTGSTEDSLYSIKKIFNF
ncbi:hydroxypyruvate isomerase family protein [Actinomycetota bacterium]